MAAVLSHYSPSHSAWYENGISTKATSSSSVFDLAGFSMVSVQSVHSGHADAATWVIQASNDGTNYVAHPNATETTSGAAGSNIEVISDWGFRYMRVTVTETDAGGSAAMNIYVVAKR